MHSATLKNLDLDVDLIRRDLDASLAISGAIEGHLRESLNQEGPLPNPTQALIAAAYYRRAGAHALLLGDRERTRDSFISATRMYDRLGIPYGAMMVSIAGYQREHYHHVREFLVYRQDKDLDLPESIHRQQIYNLLTYAAGQDSLEDLTGPAISVRRDLEVYRSHPIGILGIPLGVLLDIVDSLAPQLARNEKVITPQEAYFPLISLYSSAVRSARSNRYHWRRLALPFHPAEPDIFGIFGLTSDWLLRRFDFNLEQLFRDFPMPRESQVLLMEIYRELPMNRDFR